VVVAFRGFRSLSVHDRFRTKGWAVSVHDDFGTYEINFGTCVFCSTTSVHAKYRFCTVKTVYIIKSISVHCKLSFYAESLQNAEWMFKALGINFLTYLLVCTSQQAQPRLSGAKEELFVSGDSGHRPIHHRERR